MRMATVSMPADAFNLRSSAVRFSVIQRLHQVHIGRAELLKYLV